jgi:hypothetical protein
MITNVEKLDATLNGVINHLNGTLGHDDLAEIDEVMIVVAVHRGSTDDGTGEIGQFFYGCSSARYHTQLGMVAQLQRAVDANHAEGNRE